MPDQVDPSSLKKGDCVYVSVPKMDPLCFEGIVFEVKDSKQWKGDDWYVKVRAIKRASGRMISNQERQSIGFADDVYRSTATFYLVV